MAEPGKGTSSKLPCLYVETLDSIASDSLDDINTIWMKKPTDGDKIYSNLTLPFQNFFSKIFLDLLFYTSSRRKPSR